MKTEPTGQAKVERQLADDDVRFLAEHTDLSPRQAEELIRTHGNDREKLLELAAGMQAES